MYLVFKVYVNSESSFIFDDKRGKLDAPPAVPRVIAAGDLNEGDVTTLKMFRNCRTRTRDANGSGSTRSMLLAGVRGSRCREKGSVEAMKRSL